MSSITVRPYRGAEDVRAMQALAGELWSPDGSWHVGGLAWGLVQRIGLEPEWPTALWERAGRTVAWGWAELKGDLYLQVHPDHPALADEVIEWFHGVSTGERLSVTIHDRETHLAEALDRHGYQPADSGPFMLHLSRDLGDLPEVTLPAGFVARPLRGAADLAGRVAVHRSAFQPSRVTEDIYRAVMAAWPYRSELDCVVEAPDGQLVAYCIAWLDVENGVGEFEPVGTHGDYRRMGLAHAACAFAMQQLASMGADTVFVHARGDADYPAPATLYRGLGFSPRGRTVTYQRG